MASTDKTDARVAALAEQLARVESKLDMLVAASTRAAQPTAMAHHLLKLEEALLARCMVFVKKGGKYLERMAADVEPDDGGLDPMALLGMMSGAAGPVTPEHTPQGGKVRTRGGR